MAKLDTHTYPGFEKPWDKDPDYFKKPHVAGVDDSQTRWDAEQVKMNDLSKVSDALPPGEIVGAVLQFQIADGYAIYVVTKAKPLTLTHVNFLDGYAIPHAHVRGITKADVLSQLESRKKWAKLTVAKVGR